MNTNHTISTKSFTVNGCLRALAFCLGRSRFSVIILIVGFAILLTDQGRDLLTYYAEEHRIFNAALAATIWAISIWFWCRILLDIQYADPPSNIHCYNFFREWIPRFLGGLAFFVLAFASLLAEQYWLSFFTMVALIVFLAVVISRRWVTSTIAKRLSASEKASIRSFATSVVPPEIGPESMPPYTGLMNALGLSKQQNLIMERKINLSAIFTFALILAFVLFAVLGTFFPVWIGFRSGAMILFFIWGATWLPIGSIANYAADKCEIPLMSLLIIVALLSSFINDNHEIRTSEPDVAVDKKLIDKRPSVSQAMDAWMAENKSSGNDRTPFVIVATAGGGIRAAYWTVTVLGDLHDNTGKFAQRTFAMSGVSGGSVGATVYRALLDVPSGTMKKECLTKIKGCAQKALDNDFLGPVMAALLYPDLAQRFLPVPMLPDRGVALEKSWEQAFKDATGDDRLNMSLASLTPQPSRPSLFLNSTWVDNGRRIVASNLRYAKEDGSAEAEIFIRSNDQLAVLGHDLRLSTAAHNSARFPFVSPPGMWKRNGKIAGRLQDGGLFENYGAETAYEILDLACRKFDCDLDSNDMDSKNKGRRIKPVIILITSDPSLPEDLEKSPQNNKPSRFAYEIKSTLRAYERVRNGRGAEAVGRLKEWADIYDGEFYQFRMCATNSGANDPPLGWVLSKSAKEVINSYLPHTAKTSGSPTGCYEENAAAREKIIELLGK